MSETGLTRQDNGTAPAEPPAPQAQGRDPFAMLDALERMMKSPFIASLVDTGYYTERGDSKAQTLHKLVLRIAWGAELGMTPMWSLKNIIMIKGTATIGAAGVGSKVLQSGVVSYRIITSTATECRMEWSRFGEVVGVSEWTISDAKRARLNGDNWQKYPVDMLRSRCLTQGARAFCPDVFGGPIYTPDELRTEVVEVSQAPREPAQAKRPESPSDASVGSWAVVGSKGAHYTVRADHGRYTCTCPGFGWRRKCKHIEQVKKENP